ncbi:MAG TPA: SRPBCC domain-containing protein [Solirubrobacteraceae bacterium]|nr:SRPBCC domain-containing protein [Solirubrobacteraceae bacterium]
MAVDLDHTFATGSTPDQTFAGIVDLERVIPLVEGGTVTERTGPESANAEILVRMGAMSMTFKGTVEVVEKDDAGHRAVLRVRSKEQGGNGYANADVTFAVADAEGTVHTHAQISGKAASMGEGVVAGVLDALIMDFTGKLSTL